MKSKLMALILLASLPDIVFATGSPGGDDTQIQYNQSGTFGGIPSLIYDGTIPATAILSPEANTTVTGILLKNPITATSGNQQFAPSLQFTGHAWLTGVGDQTIDWELKTVTVDAPDSYGNAVSAFTIRHREAGGSWDNHYFYFDSLGNLSQGGGDGALIWAQINALDKLLIGNSSETGVFQAASPFGTLILAGVPNDGGNPRIVWSSGDTYYRGVLDTALGRDSAGVIGVYASYDGSVLGDIKAANFNVTGQFQVNGSQIASSNLSDGSSLVQTSRSVTIGGSTQDLSSDRSWLLDAISGVTTNGYIKRVGPNTWISETTPGWVEYKVSGSDATTTSQILTDITGLVTDPPLSTDSSYEFYALLSARTSSVNTGVEYGVNCTETPTSIFASFQGPTTVASGVQTMKLIGTNANNVPETTPFLTTANEAGMIIIHGWLTTGSSGSPVLSIRHLKVKNGTSTVKIDSVLRVKRLD